jgi:hypothetical protein
MKHTGEWPEGGATPLRHTHTPHPTPPVHFPPRPLYRTLSTHTMHCVKHAGAPAEEISHTYPSHKPPTPLHTHTRGRKLCALARLFSSPPLSTGCTRHSSRVYSLPPALCIPRLHPLGHRRLCVQLLSAAGHQEHAHRREGHLPRRLASGAGVARRARGQEPALPDGA